MQSRYSRLHDGLPADAIHRSSTPQRPRQAEKKDEAGAQAALSSLTVGAALEAAAEQCARRCLTDTATWLGELQLDAVPQLLCRPLTGSTTAGEPPCSLLSALLARERPAALVASGGSQDADALRATGCRAAGCLAGLSLDAADTRDATLLQRSRGWQRVAAGLFHKGEYYRCHHFLLRAMREVGDTLPKKRCRVGGSRNDEVDDDDDDDADNSGAADDKEGRPRTLGVRTAAQRAALRHGDADDSSSMSTSGAAFATTLLPPSLSFLCLYALYMEGQKVKGTSSSPHRVSNPHLRVLRVLLVEALKNPTNHLSSSHGAAAADAAGRMIVEASTAPVAGSLSPAHAYARRGSPAASAAPSPGCRADSAERAAAAGLPSTPRPPGPAPLLVPRESLADGDPYLSWLNGVVLRDLGLRQESAAYLLAAVQVNPLLWCAWQDLATLVSRESQLREIAAALAPAMGDGSGSSSDPGERQEGRPSGGPLSFMLEIFNGVVRGALGLPPLSPLRAFPSLQQPSAPTPPGPQLTAAAAAAGAPRTLVNTWEHLLRELFPDNVYMLTQLAAYYYHHLNDLDRAERIFQRLRQVDPYRLDYVADYSNVLFVKDDRVALASLAQSTYHFAPLQAESNFVVGNYYVLLGQHDRGVLHFHRAVAVKPDFVAAWTLLGHAYVEMRNTTAAVEAYTTAVELDPRGYRGWYSLGQIYELLQAYHHALYYYWRTTFLRPTDPRMWQAVANCLEQEGRHGESIACLERAALYEAADSDLYPALVKRIGVHYIDTRNFTRACVYLEKLANSRAASADDLLFALPFLIQQSVLQAQRVMQLPARSPSYEPATVAKVPRARKDSTPMGSPAARAPAAPSRYAGVGGARAWSPAANAPSGRPDAPGEDAGAEADPRAAVALRHLVLASEHLHALRALAATETTPPADALAPDDAAAAAAGARAAEQPGGLGADRGVSQLEKFVAKMEREVEDRRRLILQR